MARIGLRECGGFARQTDAYSAFAHARPHVGEIWGRICTLISPFESVPHRAVHSHARVTKITACLWNPSGLVEQHWFPTSASSTSPMGAELQGPPSHDVVLLHNLSTTQRHQDEHVRCDEGASRRTPHPPSQPCRLGGGGKIFSESRNHAAWPMPTTGKRSTGQLPLRGQGSISLPVRAVDTLGCGRAKDKIAGAHGWREDGRSWC